MAQVIVTHRLDTAAINLLLRGQSGATVKNMLQRGKRVEGEAKRLAKTDRGRLRTSIHASLVESQGVTGVQIGSNLKYAIWVHEGTGIYGPQGQMIRSPRGKVMVYRPRKFNASGRRIKSGKIFIQKSRGQKPNRFLADAMPAARR
jgi:hypothetical protein